LSPSDLPLDNSKHAYAKRGGWGELGDPGRQPATLCRTTICSGR